MTYGDAAGVNRLDESRRSSALNFLGEISTHGLIVGRTRLSFGL